MNQRLIQILSNIKPVQRVTIRTTTVSVKNVTRSLEDIPGPDGIRALPYIGPAFLFHPFGKHKLEESNRVFDELYEKYGPVVRLRQGKNWAVFLFDPADVEDVFKNEGKFPLRMPIPLLETYFKRKNKKPGLSLLQGEEWHRMRQLVQRETSRPSVVNEYIPQNLEVADDLIEWIERGPETGKTLEDLLLEYTVESTAHYCFNSRFGFLDECDEKTELENAKLLRNIKKFMILVASSLHSFPSYKYYRTKLYKEFEKAADFVYSIGERKIKLEFNRLKHNQVDEKEQSNLLRALLRNQEFDEQTVYSSISGFFSVATDNIARQLAILLWILAKYPEKQEKLYQEITGLYNKENCISPAALSHMPYLKSCYKESYRYVFPSSVGVGRIMSKDCNIGGYYIPAGTLVYIGNNSMSRNPKVFSNPDEYVPERWMHTTDQNLRRLQSFAVLPFGFGPRNCVGKRFSENQIYVLVVKLLLKYNIKLKNPNEKLEISYNLLATLKNPLELVFEKR